MTIARNRTHGISHITSPASNDVGLGVPLRGEDFFQQQLIVFWGPGQYIQTDLAYVPPQNWPEGGRLLRNIRIARIIHDAFVFSADEDDDSGDPDGGGNPGGDGCQIQPELLGQQFFFCLCLTRSWRSDPNITFPQGLYFDIAQFPGFDCLDDQVLYGAGPIGDSDPSDNDLIIRYQNATSPAGLPKNIFTVLGQPLILNIFRIATRVDANCNPTEYFLFSEQIETCTPVQRLGIVQYWQS